MRVLGSKDSNGPQYLIISLVPGFNPSTVPVLEK